MQNASRADPLTIIHGVSSGHSCPSLLSKSPPSIAFRLAALGHPGPHPPLADPASAR